MASFLYIGAQIVVAYSRCGRTRDLNKFSVHKRENSNYEPNYLVSFCHFGANVFCKVNLLSNMTPKFFSLLTFSMLIVPIVVFMVYAVSSMLFPTCRWWHFLWR